MINKKTVSLLIVMLILGAVLLPLPHAYAETAAGSQSSFEYKNYADQDEYKSALDSTMHRVYSNIGGAIDDKATIPIPGLVSTYTKSGGDENTSSSFVPQGICQAGKYILITAYQTELSDIRRGYCRKKAGVHAYATKQVSSGRYRF